MLTPLILNLADAHNNRGGAYLGKGEYDRAIELGNSYFTYAYYYNRGLAYNKKGETARATADFNRAKELKAK